MSGNVLIDSNVFIYASKGQIDLANLIEPFDFLFTSVICYAEVLGYNFQDSVQEQAVVKLMQAIKILPVTQEIADIAIEYRKKRKIKLADALVLATAKYINATLLTANVRDFKNLDNDIEILSPF